MQQYVIENKNRVYLTNTVKSGFTFGFGDDGKHKSRVSKLVCLSIVCPLKAKTPKSTITISDKIREMTTYGSTKLLSLKSSIEFKIS